MPEQTINRDEHGPRVLDDVRVLDFTGVIAGAYCTRMMADLGAEVVKIENPQGEVLRHAGPMRGSVSALFSALNSGKRCVALDLKHAAAVDLCKRLVHTHDVVVENYSPGVMARLGLDYAALRAVNPRIIMCSISGYGQTGPDAMRPAYAPIVQAMSGFEAVYARAQHGDGRPLNMGLPVGDTAAAQQAFGAIMAALYYRSRSGTGQYIDISMQDTLLASMHKDFQIATLGDDNDRHYGPLATRDGFVIVVPLNQHHFERLVDCVGKSHLRDDPRFATTVQRIRHYDALQAEVENWTKTQTSAAALAAFDALKLPCARYRTLAELDTDAQLRHRDMMTTISDAAGALTVPNSPFLYSDTHAAVGRTVGRIGEDNHAVLQSVLGLGPDDISALEQSGALGPAPAATGTR